MDAPTPEIARQPVSAPAPLRALRWFLVFAFVCSWSVSVLLLSRAPLARAATAIQINAGGPAISPFVADTDFSGGGTSSTSATVDTSGLSYPAPQAVYQTARLGNFSYTIPNLTPGANYTVRLHFAETYWTA
uniref:malectin domain-containing carbohydrate-binding protein n=1 Tax=Thermogemmatispora sp. TaxID=1968838 RepID=UPI002ACC0580